MQKYIDIKKASTHNLKNLSVQIPKNQLVVLTGVSGSGKSSLAFDTLYAEGQRRYVESLSSYARQFLGLMEKPDVESITGLSPAISIDQKTSSHNPRSTVGTVTEIYDYMRILYTQLGQPYCPKCNIPVESQTIAEIKRQIVENRKEGDKIIVLSPIVQNQKGEFKEMFNNLLQKGFLRILIDKKLVNLDEVNAQEIEKNKKHNIDLVIDRLIYKENNDEFEKRIVDALELASNMADGEIKIEINGKNHFFSEKNTCNICKFSFPKITPATFSFNSPIGACTKCSGLGFLKEAEIDKIYNPNLTIYEGGIFPWANMTTSASWTLRKLESVAERHNFDLRTPIGKYPKNIFDLIFYGKGAKEKYPVTFVSKKGRTGNFETIFEGVIPELERRYRETDSEWARAEYEKYMFERECSECEGTKLKKFVLSIKFQGKNIDELTKLTISDLNRFLEKENKKLKGSREQIAKPLLKEIQARLQFLENVGLTYLTLSRKANTLSGGEAQRIRLASQIGTGLTGVLYVLDEPSIGLHPRDISRLIKTLKDLKELDNTVVVVEHDYETIKEANWIIDIGPGAGENGGKVVAQGKYEDIAKNEKSLTGQYLSNKKVVGDSLKNIKIEKQKNHKKLKIVGAKTHNLKNIDVEIPLGKLICVTGVSGSGKSSLISNTLYPALMNEKMKSKMQNGSYNDVEGLENIKKVISISQSPIGRTPRSNPATYTGIFTYIREIFSQTPESRARGYKPGRFSFNVRGGRCESCQGDGQKKIEMQFLPDMYITCEECDGKRYNKEALQIDYKGQNIADILNMTVTEASKFFNNFNPIKRKLELLESVGLGYIRLGQSATTLSGGESQRIKLAKELSKVVKDDTVYILDEPTTGLHFHDIDKLLVVLKQLVNKGNTVIVIEHNLDVIKFADWIIDLGPEGGDKGGRIIAKGTVDDVIKNEKSWTGKFLKEYLSPL
jgi:excinuclease ABC subunit A